MISKIITRVMRVMRVRSEYSLYLPCDDIVLSDRD